MAPSNDMHVIEKGSQVLTTPMGRPVVTSYKSLAERLVRDLSEFGESPNNPASLVAFHYSMIDFFDVMPRNLLEQNVALGFDRERDWTFRCPSAAPEPMRRWWNMFGIANLNMEQGKEWLSKISLTQLCAVCVLGAAIESVNIPYILATEISQKNIRRYAFEVDKYYPYVGKEDLARYFENFKFYYSLDDQTGAQSRQAANGEEPWSH